jgi:ribosome-binding ATPase YchF (GTP1/OBG family)
VPVPDERLEALSKLSNSKKTVPAVIEFVDIAGLVKGAAAGEGLGNKFLQNIREVDAIAEVVRIFEDADILHVHNKVDPLSDIEVINLELILADLESVNKRRGNLVKEIKANKREALEEEAALMKIQKALEESKLASTVSLDPKELLYVKGMHFLTMKPILYVLNTSEASEVNKREVMAKIPGPYVEIDPVFERGLTDLIKKSYETLGLATFLTTGEDESRAWTIKKDSTAPVAGQAIHNDFKDKFIRAEVVFWKDLLDNEGYVKAREKGLVRTEGKEYIVKDGDVIEFRV